MVREEEVKTLARSIWEAAGRPKGRDWDHYFRAKRMLEEKERILSHMDGQRATNVENVPRPIKPS